jgi:hypothetical protein
VHDPQSFGNPLCGFPQVVVSPAAGLALSLAESRKEESHDGMIDLCERWHGDGVGEVERFVVLEERVFFFFFRLGFLAGCGRRAVWIVRDAAALSGGAGSRGRFWACG